MLQCTILLYATTIKMRIHTIHTSLCIHLLCKRHIDIFFGQRLAEDKPRPNKVLRELLDISFEVSAWDSVP